MAKFDRVTRGTGRVVEFMTGKSPAYNGLFKKLGIDGRDPSNGNRLVTIEAKPKGNIIKVDYQTKVSDAKITDIWKALSKQYGLVEGPNKGSKYTSVFIGTLDAEQNVKEIRFEKTKPGGGGVIPTDIQEKGATIVLTHALKSKGAKFQSDADIRNDKKTWEALSTCFKGWEHRIDGWLWTYYQQNKLFFDTYSDGAWAPFEFGSKDFVTFFKEHMENLNRDFKNPDGTEPAGKYETWNPADIWAVKSGRASKLKSDIKKAIPNPSHLLELNGILVEYMENNELVGISLKKISAPREAQIHLYNVDNSSKLKAMTAFSGIEQYDMSDIEFEPDHILELSSVTTYIRIGPNQKYSISITRSGNNTSFTAQIKRNSKDAQGGQTPINQVIKLLSGNEFSKSEKDYPQTAVDFIKPANTKKYKKYYNLVYKHAKNKSKILKWDDWQKEMVMLYAKDDRDAKVSLMQLTFWYSAIQHHANDPEFWTDMLYYGMKITAKGEFAPHAKIS